jgi:hypothetical protein
LVERSILGLTGGALCAGLPLQHFTLVLCSAFFLVLQIGLQGALSLHALRLC